MAASNREEAVSTALRKAVWKPPAWIKSLLRLLFRAAFRIELQGAEHLKVFDLPTLVVANHVSLLDGVLLYAFLPGDPIFIVDQEQAARPLIRKMLSLGNTFHVTVNNPHAIKAIVKVLRQNQTVVIFPEGRITTTGAMMRIYGGSATFIEHTNAQILPIALEGLQYSLLSYLRGLVRRSPFPTARIRVLPPERLQLSEQLRGRERHRESYRQLEELMHRVGFYAKEHRRELFPAFLEAARRHGMGRKICQDEENTLSYRGLIIRAWTLARALRREGINQERIGVLLPNRLVLLVIFLTLQARRQTAAMLNYTVGAQSCLQACETAKLQTILSSRRFIELAGLQELAQALQSRHRLIFLEDLRGRIRLTDRLSGLARSLHPALARHCRRSSEQPDRPAVILFTSGTEGRPKGVTLSHANLLSNVCQVRCHLDLNKNDLLFNCLPMFHSFGLTGGMLIPLLSGCHTFLYPNPLNYKQIPMLIYQHRASILFSTNTFLRGYARYAHPYDLHTLRYVFAGAEKLYPETTQLWLERFGIRILQGYGVTECSPVISFNTPIANKLGSVGKLMPELQWQLEPVAGIETGGRLLVRGPNVMLGYLDPVSGEINPPSSEPGWYDTGDIADVDSEGYLHILGRVKAFVKIGGEMISLRVVEELAMRCWPQSLHAAVGLPDPRRGERIVLLTDTQNADAATLRKLIRAEGYSELFIPHRIVKLKSLPLLSTGKPDYGKLKALAEAG